MIEKAREFLKKIGNRNNGEVRIQEEAQVNLEEPAKGEADSSNRESEEHEGNREAVYYQQWYEADTERWQREEQAMQKKNFQSRVYQDGRIMFMGKIMNFETMIFLDYQYPLKPPFVYVLSEEQVLPKDFINEDGSIDLFRKEKHWNANTMTASIVIDWIEALLSLLDSLRQSEQT